MIGFVKSLFKSGDNGEKLLDAGIKGIDALYFTDEEKSQASKELLTTFIDFQKATQAQNLARRYLAFGVTFIWAILVVTITVFAVLASLMESPVLAMSAKAVTTVMSDYVFYPFSGIMAFYFLTHTLRSNKK